MRFRAVSVVIGAMTLGLSVGPAAVAAPSGAGARSVSTTPPPDVKAFGDAEFLGATNSFTFNQPIAGIAGTQTSRGYWEAATDGGIFAFGDAKFHGSMGGKALNQPIVGIAAAPTVKGYWLVARDGGIFSFGDAKFYGSMGGRVLAQPVVGVAATHSGRGYWLAAGDGGVFSFGDAHFYGPMFNGLFGETAVGIAARPQGDGYWIVTATGGLFRWGGAGSLGDARAADVSKPVVGIASTRTGAGFWVASRGTPSTVPGQVTVIRAGHSGGSGEIGLLWTGVPGATGYRIERADTAAGPFSIAAELNLLTGTATMVAPGVTNIFSDQQNFRFSGSGSQTGVRPSRHFEYVEYPFPRHYFRVTASNANGDGASSVVVCGTPIGEPPC